MRRLAIILLITIVGSGSGRANDTTAELATGGLLFVPNDHIEMRSEDLYLAATAVRVRYRFFNKSDRAITVLVAFPMPEIRLEHQHGNIAVPTEDPVNLLGFATTVNGRPVTTQVEQRVVAAGIDRTRLLRQLGIPLAPHLSTTNTVLNTLPRERWDELLRLGLAEIVEYDVGKGMQQHLAARWALHTTFYWEQTFLPQVETVIEHRYTPSVGTSAGTALGLPEVMQEPWYAEYTRKYCLDGEFFAALARARQAAQSAFGAPYAEERIDYILKTGANWSGPIKAFRLVIDKGAPDNLVSFCGQNVQQIGPTQFEMQQTDFTPGGNLAVLILKKRLAQ
jgi:hypothetical protein